MTKNGLLAIGLLTGTIIGAGIFSLPFVFKTAGLASGFFYLILAVVVYIFVYRMYAEVILKTPGQYRFVGYTQIYLGKNFSWVAILISIVQSIFVLTIYLILSQSFGNLITSIGHGVHKMIIFWVLGSAAVFLGLRRIAWLEFFITSGIAAIILVIFILAAPHFNELSGRINFFPDWKNFFLPFAPILFALSGRVAIPEVVKLGNSSKKSIIFGVLVPAFIYILFVLSILILSPRITEDAVSGLIGYAPPIILIAIGILGVLSILSSYITVGLDVYATLGSDLNFPDWLRFFLVIFGPIALYLAGFTNFLGLVSFVGGILLALEGIFIIWIWLKATKRMVSPGVLLLFLIFAAALIYEIIK